MPGIGRGAFAAWAWGKYLIAGIITQVCGDGAWILLLPLIGLNVYMVLSRVRNLGVNPWWTLAGLNILGMIYLCLKESPRRKKRKPAPLPNGTLLD